MLRDGPGRIVGMAATGIAVFAIGVYGGLAGLLASVGLGGLDELSAVTVSVGLGTAFAAGAVALVSRNTLLVWRPVLSRSAVVGGLWIVTLITWDLDVSWMIATAVTVVAVAVWSASSVGDRVAAGAAPNPATGGSSPDEVRFEAVRDGVWASRERN